MMPVKPKSAEQFDREKAADRRTKSLEKLARVLEETDLQIPPPVTDEDLKPTYNGQRPKMSAEAYELARQVYYVQYGTVADAARAIIRAGLSERDDETLVFERLKTWWDYRGWPRRPHALMVAIRDANFDGGLIRGELCSAVTTGSGPAPAGKPCGQSRLKDSVYCYHHDPRPEYEERRREQGKRFAAARLADLVPLQPWIDFCDRERRRLLAEARQRGPVHHNSDGWQFLADAMGIKGDLLWRLVRAEKKRGEKRTKIRAKTVVKYVERLGSTFEEIYGFPPPEPGLGQKLDVCPSCGGRKVHDSELCRTCWEDQRLGTQCKYVTKFGRRCPTRTNHPSGYCKKCQEIVFHVPRPRTGKPSSITPKIALHLLDAYRDSEVQAWAARRVWAANIGGVRSAYKDSKSLRGSMAKYFRKRGWRSRDDTETTYWKLLAEHGPLEWPAEGQAAELEVAGMVPVGPFVQWLRDRHEELGSYRQLALRIRANPDAISKWIRGKNKVDVIERKNVDRYLSNWGDGTRFEDLYETVLA